DPGSEVSRHGGMLALSLDGYRVCARRKIFSGQPGRPAGAGFDGCSTACGCMNFSAVILAGGKSVRMGCDKSFVELAGQTLLARQVQLVRAAGAIEVFISGRTGADYSTYVCRVLVDKFQGAGPLAGLH